jgi:hypothetical protein
MVDAAVAATAAMNWVNNNPGVWAGHEDERERERMKEWGRLCSVQRSSNSPALGYYGNHDSRFFFGELVWVVMCVVVCFSNCDLGGGAGVLVLGDFQ